MPMTQELIASLPVAQSSTPVLTEEQIAQQQALQQAEQQKTLDEISQISLPIAAKAKTVGLSDSEKALINPQTYDFIYNRQYFDAKYGPNIGTAIDEGVSEFIPNVQDDRNFAETWGDRALGFGWGLVRDIGQLGALGLKATGADDTALTISRNLNQADKWVDENLHSKYWSNAKKASSLINIGRDALLNLQDEENKRKGDGETLRTLKMVGNDFLNGLESIFSDKGQFESSFWENVPSFLLSGGLFTVGSKGAKAVAKAMPIIEKTLAKVAATKGGSAAAKIVFNPEFIINAVIESSGSISEAVATVDAMTPEELRRSPDFVAKENAYRNEGLSAEGAFQKAKDDLAKSVSSYAAAITAPIAGMAGHIAGKALTRTPLRALQNWNPVKNGGIAANAVREWGEETIQGAQVIGQNIGLQKAGYDVNTFKDVGKEAAIGGVTGFAIGGAAPVAGSSIQTAKNAAKTIRNLAGFKPLNEDSIEASKAIRSHQENLLTQLEQDEDLAVFSKRPEVFSESEPDKENKEAHNKWEKKQETWRKEEEQWREKAGLIPLSLEKQLTDSNTTAEQAEKIISDYIAESPENQEKYKRTLLYQDYDRLKTFLKQSKDAYVGRNSLEGEDSPFPAHLKKISGRNDINDYTAEVFDDDKTLVENYTNIVKKARELAKKGKSRDAIEMLQDAQAMTSVINDLNAVDITGIESQLATGISELLPNTKQFVNPSLLEDELKKFAQEELGATITDNSTIDDILSQLKRKEKIQLRKKAQELVKQQKEDYKKLSPLEKQAIKIFQSTGPIAQLHNANRAKSLPLGNQIDFQREVGNIVSSSPDLQEWYDKTKNSSVEELDKLSEADKQLFHAININQMYSDKQSRHDAASNPSEQTNLPVAQKRHMIELLQHFIKDKSLNSTTKQIYQRALKGLAAQEEFLAENPESRVTEIHEELTTTDKKHSDSITQKGLGTAIPEHLIRLTQAIEKAREAKKLIIRGKPTDETKALFEAIKNQTGVAFQQLYDFAWSQRNKYYALFAGKDLFQRNSEPRQQLYHLKQEYKDTPRTEIKKRNALAKQIKELQEKLVSEHKSDPGRVRYNSVGYTENRELPYWSEQNTTSLKGKDYRQSVYYNDSKSGDFITALEYELTTLAAITNDFAQDINEIFGKDTVPSFEYETDLFEKDSTGQYEKYSQLAKEPSKLAFISKSVPKKAETATEPKPDETGTKPDETSSSTSSGSILEKHLAAFIQKLVSYSSLEDFKSIHVPNLDTIQYKGKNILNRSGEKNNWVTTLELTDYPEHHIFSPKENGEISMLFNYLQRQRRQEEKSSTEDNKKPSSTVTTTPIPTSTKPVNTAKPSSSSSTKIKPNTEYAQTLTKFLTEQFSGLNAIVIERAKADLGISSGYQKGQIIIFINRGKLKTLFNHNIMSNSKDIKSNLIHEVGFKSFDDYVKVLVLIEAKYRTLQNPTFSDKHRIVRETLESLQQQNLLNTVPHLALYYFINPKNNRGMQLTLSEDKLNLTLETNEQKTEKREPYFRLEFIETQSKKDTSLPYVIFHFGKSEGTSYRIALSKDAFTNYNKKEGPFTFSQLQEKLQDGLRSQILGDLKSIHERQEKGIESTGWIPFKNSRKENEYYIVAPNAYTPSTQTGLTSLFIELLNTEKGKEWLTAIIQNSELKNYIQLPKQKETEVSEPKPEEPVIKEHDVPETEIPSVFWHGGLEHNFDFSKLDVFKPASKQNKKGRSSYVGFYFYGDENQQGAVQYANQNKSDFIHKIVFKTTPKVRELETNGDIERLTKEDLQRYIDQGYDLLRGKDSLGRNYEYLLLNPALIQNTEEIFIKKGESDIVSNEKQTNKLIQENLSSTPGLNTEVVNIHSKQYGTKDKWLDNNHETLYIYGGRPSPLGNPYELKNSKNREDSCIKCWTDKEWLKRVDAFIDYLKTLKEKYPSFNKVFLGCWCAPKLCHLNFVAKRVQEEVFNQQEQPETPVNPKPETSTSVLNIWYGTNENKELSNLAARPFTYQGHDYVSVEHAYQTLKSGKFDEETYKQAWTEGRKFQGKKADIKTNQQLMYDLILESFKQNPEAAKILLDTGSATFTHISTLFPRDLGIWKEAFPRILMQVRDELKNIKPQSNPKPETPINSKPEQQIDSSVALNKFTLHSGGAIGSDSYWGEIASKYGAKVNHYFIGKKSDKNAPNGNIDLTNDKVFITEADKEITLASKTIGYEPGKTGLARNLIRRNWMQIKSADEVFAIINDFKLDKPSMVSNKGTGWAIEMAKNHKKRIVVFNQANDTWYEYDYTNEEFIEYDSEIPGDFTDTPVPYSYNFAAIGSRDIKENGKQAIELCLKKLSKNPDKYINAVNKPDTPVQVTGTNVVSEPKPDEQKSVQQTDEEKEKELKEFINKTVFQYLFTHQEKFYHSGRFSPKLVTHPENLDDIKKKNAVVDELITYIFNDIQNRDLNYLNNEYYLETLLSDYFDIYNYPENNPAKSMPNTGIVLKQILPKLLNILTNGEIIASELRENRSPFKTYFIKHWNEKQQEYLDTEKGSFEKSQNLPRKAIRIFDFIVDIAEGYVPETSTEIEETEPTEKKIAPEVITTVLEQNNASVEPITIDAMFPNLDDTASNLQKLALTSIKNAFVSITKPITPFKHKSHLLNYASSPLTLLHTIWMKAQEEANKEGSTYFTTAQQYNQNSQSISKLFLYNDKGLETTYDLTSNPKSHLTLTQAAEILFFGNNSLASRLYSQLEEYALFYPTQTEVFHSTRSMRNTMLAQNRVDGVSKAEKNRNFWLTLDKEGKPILNRHLAEKAIIGAIVAVANNNCGKLNINKNMDDIDDRFPGINIGIKQAMARTLPVDRFLSSIGQSIKKYLDLSFRGSLDVIAEETIVESLAMDILRLLENEGIFRKHFFLISKEKDSNNFIKFRDILQDTAKGETIAELYQRLDDIRKGDSANGLETIPYVHFEFTPSAAKFYQLIPEKAHIIAESLDLFGSIAPDVIDTLVFPESISNILIGDEGTLPVATNQRNTDVKLTQTQRDNIKSRQESKYYLNGMMFSLAKVLATETGGKSGNETYIDIMLRRENLSPDNAEVLDDVKSTIEGQQIATQNSIGNMNHLISRMLAYTQNGSISAVPLRFKYDIQRMGRLMLDGFNPQADKMFRELFLPKAGSVDLSQSSKVKNIFLRAVLQSVGDKVQYIRSGQDYVFYGNKTIEQGILDEENELNSSKGIQTINLLLTDEKYKDITLAYQQLISSPRFKEATEQDSERSFTDSALTPNEKKIITNFIDIFHEVFEGDATWIALHGVSEYLRYDYLKNSPDQLKNFTTQLYLEADGIASGASNSIFLFSTISDYKAISRKNPFSQAKEEDFPGYKFMLRAGGGFGITGSFGAIMHETNQEKNDDIYGSIAKSMKAALSEIMLDSSYQNAVSIVTPKTSPKIIKILEQFSKENIQNVLLPWQEKFDNKEFKIIEIKDDYGTTSISNYTHNLLALYSSLIPNINITSIDDLATKFEIKRNWIKNPLTKYNYGAGARSIAVGLVAGNNLYPGIVDSYIKKLTEYNLAKNNKEKRDQLREELKEITYRLAVAASFSIKETTQGYFLSYAKDAHNFIPVSKKGSIPSLLSSLTTIMDALEKDTNIKTNFSFDPRIIQVLNENTLSLISQTMSNIITEEMYGAEFAANKKLMLSANSLMSLIYSTLYIDRSIQEASKKEQEYEDNKASYDRDTRAFWLTRREQTNIREELSDLAPTYHQDLNLDVAEQDADSHEMNQLDADFLAIKTGKWRELSARFSETNSIFSFDSIKTASVFSEGDSKKKATVYQTYPSSLNLHLPMDSGVLVLPQTVVGMSEAVIMRILATMKAIGLDVFDGFNMPIPLVAAIAEGKLGLGELANKAVYEAWVKSNVYKSIGDRLDTFYRKLYGSENQETPYAKLFHSHLSTPLEYTYDKDTGARTGVDFEKLNPIQQIFVQNIASAIEGFLTIRFEETFDNNNSAYVSQILESLGLDGLPGLVSDTGSVNRSLLAEVILPTRIKESDKENPDILEEEYQNMDVAPNKTLLIKKVLFGLRVAMLKAEQKITIKQKLFSGFTDVSVDQMGGGATPYNHKAEIINYTNKFSGEKETITAIPSYPVYKQQAGNAVTYEQYLKELFIPNYLNAFNNLINTSKEYDFISFVKGTILEDMLNENNELSDLGAKIFLHDTVASSLNDALISTASELSDFDIRKELKLVSFKDMLNQVQNKLSLVTYNKRRKLFQSLIRFFKKHRDSLDSYRVLVISPKYLKFLKENIGNSTVENSIINYLKKNNISVDYYPSLLKEKIILPQATPLGYASSGDTKIITLVSESIQKAINYNEEFASIFLHETGHALTLDYLYNNLVFDSNTEVISINPKAKLTPVEKIALNHIIDMFNQYYSLSDVSTYYTNRGYTDKYDIFREFVTEVQYNDYFHERVLRKFPNELRVEQADTLQAKLKHIWDTVKKAIQTILQTLLNDRTVEYSDVFTEARTAIATISEESHWKYTPISDSETQNTTDLVSAFQPVRNSNFVQEEQTIKQRSNKKRFNHEQRLRDLEKKSLPVELALVNDDGSKNLQVNQQLQNIASLLYLSNEEQEAFTERAKQIHMLLIENPSQIYDAVVAIQEFYKQLSIEALTKITSQDASDMRDIYDLAQSLKSSFEQIAGKDIAKRYVRNQFGFSLAIPVILALNDVSPVMQDITSKMNYSLLRSDEATDLNQHIRDIAHNLYIKIQGKKNEQNVQKQLENIYNETRINGFLQTIDYVPSINPLLNTLDNQFNKIMDDALAYVCSHHSHFGNTLAMLMNPDSDVAKETLDFYLMTKDDNFYSSMLKEMLPSSNYRKNVFWLRKLVKAALDQERQDYRTIRPNHIKNLFKYKYSNQEWRSLTRSVAHTDLACLSAQNRQIVLNAIKQNKTATLKEEAYSKCDEFLEMLPAPIRTKLNKSRYQLYSDFIEPLAQYLATKQILHPNNFYKNSYIIASQLLGNKFIYNLLDVKSKDLERVLDEAVTFAAISLLPKEHLDTLQKVMNQDEEALNKVINILQQAKAVETKKIDSSSRDGIRAKLNAWKGYLPENTLSGLSIELARMSDRENMEKHGYTFLKLANTSGSNLDRVKLQNNQYKTDLLGYFYTSLPKKSMFNEGIFAIVLSSFFGSNLLTRHTMNNPQIQNLSTIIEEPMTYESHSDILQNDAVALIPTYRLDDKGNVIEDSHELFINDTELLEKLTYQDYLPEMIGFWEGRQKEESVAIQYNQVALNLILDGYDAKFARNYVNILDPKQLNKVQRDAVEQIPWNIRMLGSQMFKDKYGIEGIWVRKDVIRDTIGQRSASVMDIYNGISNLSPQNQERIKKCLEIMLGKRAYKIAVGGEQMIQGLVSTARNMIVIKSVKVMALNDFGNIWHLMAIGVPFKFIIGQLPKLLKESETYAQYGFEYQKLLVARDSTTDVQEKQQLQAQIDILNTKIKTLSIAPILSEFSSINDLGLDTDDLELMRGQVAHWITEQVNKLPKGMVVAGKHILMTKDTPQYQFLEKATQYGDFIAKAILYNYMTKELHTTHEEARFRVLDEFVNYDQLGGRTRSYLENMGLLWFFNYKLRIMKVALKLLQEHPFRALLLLYSPQWSPAGDTANVLEDSILGKILSGELSFTLGPGMLWRGLQMHPLLELLS